MTIARGLGKGGFASTLTDKGKIHPDRVDVFLQRGRKRTAEEKHDLTENA